MYLKPSDFGPLYKQPILAQVYTAVMKDSEDYFKELDDLYSWDELKD